jgi:predicted GNAT family acetyltransferase
VRQQNPAGQRAVPAPGLTSHRALVRFAVCKIAARAMRLLRMDAAGVRTPRTSRARRGACLSTGELRLQGPPMDAARPVRNNIEEGRFELRLGEGIAFLTYEVDDDRIELKHTEVPAGARGRGYGA